MPLSLLFQMGDVNEMVRQLGSSLVGLYIARECGTYYSVRSILT